MAELPLHHAAMVGNVWLMNALLSHGARLMSRWLLLRGLLYLRDATNGQGNTVLVMAILTRGKNESFTQRLQSIMSTIGPILDMLIARSADVFASIEGC